MIRLTNRFKSLQTASFQLIIIELLKQLSVCAGYILLAVWLFDLSAYFETIQGKVSWYLVAGLRLIVFLLFPFRFWFVLWVANKLFSAYIAFRISGVFEIQLFYGVQMYVFIMGAAFIYRRYLGSPSLANVKSVVILFVIAALANLFKGSLLNDSIKSFQDLTGDAWLIHQLSMMLGDFMGQLLIIPPVLLCHWLFYNHNKLIVGEFYKLFISLATCICVVIFFYWQRPDSYYLIRLLAFIPVIWLAYRFGWLGGVSGAIAANSLIALQVAMTGELQNTMESQMYILTITLTALILGAAVSELREANSELKKNNQRLKSLADKNSALAQKVVNVQESERKFLSQELHDEVGQNITALKIELKILQHRLMAQIPEDALTDLHLKANAIYASVYDLMHWLRPRVLDDLGLEEAIKGANFNELLDNTNIQYIAQVSGEVNTLSPSHKIAIYRICQEAITNTIKHSQARQFSLILNVKSNEVYLSLRDNGIGTHYKKPATLDLSALSEDNATATGFGLKGIEDRIMSLKGDMTIDDSNGFWIEAHIPIKA